MTAGRTRPFFLLRAFLSLLTLMLAGVGQAARAESYVVFPAVVGPSGGVLCGSPAHDLVFTLGEPAVGHSANEHYTLWAGFKPKIRVTVLCPTWVGVEETRVALPDSPRILGLRPNPTDGALQILYGLPSATPVSISVIDPSGRIVRHLTALPRTAGSQTMTWNGRDDGGQLVAAGVYVVRLQAGSHTDVRKAIIIR